MDCVGDVLQVRLEQAAGVGIGDHHPGNVGPQSGLERGQIDPARFGCRDILHAEPGKGSGCRIGAVGAFRNEDDLAVLAPGFERRLDREDAAQFPVRARLGRHGNAVHTGQGNQPIGQFVDHGQGPLHGFTRLERVDILEALHPRHRLVEARVVLHRARAEREEAQIDAIVLAAEARVVAHCFRF